MDSNVSENSIERVGPYRLEERLGAGGMGAVFRAFDERLERPVALKQILPHIVERPRARQRFQREARSAARLNHPGIVKIHDLLEAEGCDWIVMEMVEGKTLARLLERGALPLERAFEFGAEIAEALAAAHAEGIVHRDLKAKNVLISTDSRVKILDFGLAKQVLHSDGKSTSITEEGQLLGTPQAMSPEQAMGRKVDLRSDLFSLGSLLYEMVTGVAPFRAPSSLESITQVCTYHPPPIYERVPSLPRTLSGLVAQLLEKDPAHRPRGAAEVALELRRIAAAPHHENSLEDNGDTRLDSGATIDTADAALSGKIREQTPSERRQVTVMCCELVASDTSSSSRALETLYPATAEFEALARDVVKRFEGHIANTLGDRLVIYFGYPRVQEDAARRAASAARELKARFTTPLAGSQKPRGLTVRVGIHTGPAVVLGDSGEGQLALGQTLDLTTALQRSAEPGDILVSDTVRRLVSKTHSLVKVPSTDQKNVAFRLIDDGNSSSQWQIVATPFVARQQEIEILSLHFQRAREGAGQVVLLSGEAGIGKSRMVNFLEEKLESEEMIWLVAQGSPITKSSPFQPIIDLVLQLFKLGQDTGWRDTTPDQELRRLEEGLDRHGLDPNEVAPLFANLLSLPTVDRYPSLEITPLKQREMTLQALMTLFLKMARRQPLTLIIEDLHWIDPSTLDLLGLLIDHGSDCSLLLLLTFRPEFRAPWGTPSHLTQLNLERLTGSEVSSLIDRVTRGKRLSEEVRHLIIAKTDGIPLFVEELTKNLVESNLLIDKGEEYDLEGSFDSLAIPTTLRDSLMARLDRLGAAKGVAQLAATIGREFSHQLLAAVSTLEEQVLQYELDRLVAAELIYRRGFSSRQRYLFKHALVQDAAYDSLLKRQRQAHHKKIANVLKAEFSSITKNQPEILAHHYTEASLPEQGSSYWQKAGQRNFGNSAIIEARQYLAKGLEVTKQIPRGETRSKSELDIQMTLAEVLTNLEGMASSNAKGAYEKTIQIAQESGDNAKLYWSIFGLWRSNLTQAKYDEAMQYAIKLQSVNTSGDMSTTLFQKYTIATTHYFKGEHLAAQALLDNVIELDGFDRTYPLVSQYSGEDPGINSLHFSSVNSWLMGYPDKARELTQKALNLAKKTSHVYSMTYITTGLAMLNLFMNNPLETIEASKAAVDLSIKQGSWWKFMAQIYYNWARVVLSDKEKPDHLHPLRCDIDAYRSIGMKAHTSKFLAILATAALHHEEFEIAQSALDQACAMMRKTGEGFFEAEVYRLCGELELAVNSDTTQSAEYHFTRALESARRRSAKSLELRAALSLGRLFASQDRRSEAHDLVAGVYDWFTEGFDTVDLQAAEIFLQEVRRH